MEVYRNKATFKAASRKEWRQWLENNHRKEDSVWLIIYKKKSKVISVTYKEAVEEAICFGWVDSLPNKRDEISYFQYFSKRKANSNWSMINKEIAEKMLKEGRMADQGMKMVAIAKENGKWNILNDVEQLILPAELINELKNHKSAYRNFTNFPKSVKRGILEWIINAKREETKTKRIKETAQLAEQNVRANQYIKGKNKS